MNETPNVPVNNGKGFSIAGLVLGIIAVVLGFFSATLIMGILGLICGIVGIILAVKGKKLAVASGAPTGLATAGLVLSIIGTAVSALLFIFCGLCIVCAAGSAGLGSLVY